MKAPSLRETPTLAEVRKWPATVGIPEAARALGISRAHMYELVRRGEAPVKILPLGSRQRVITASLVAVLEAA